MEKPQIQKTRTMRLVELENGGRPLEELLPELLGTMDVRAIAHQWGVHFTMVYEWMRQLDIPTRSRAPRNYQAVGSK